MGSEKQETKGTTVVNQTTTPTPTAEETAFNKLKLEQQQAWNQPQTEMGLSAMKLGNQLLTSFGDPGSQMWQSLIGGVTPEQQQSMIAEQQRYLNPQFQQQGLLDSGLAYTGSLRAATDIANQNAQFNVGALQNALNLALSGQAQVQQPVLGAAGQLGSQLAGLRSYNQSGTTSSNQTVTSMNPFLKSFQQSLGQTLGSPKFSMGPFSMGG